MKRLATSFLSLVGSVGLLAQSDKPITALQQFSARLPNGIGKVLVLKYCVGCHGAEVTRAYLENGRAFDMEGWEATMEEEEVDWLTTYFEKHFDPWAEPPDEAEEVGESWTEVLLQPGPEKELFLQRCTPCHADRAIGHSFESRVGLSQQSWEVILNRMRGYGTPLSEEEMEQLSGYLETSLGSQVPSTQRDLVVGFYSDLAEGAGRDLVMGQCLSCHGVSDLREAIQRRPAEDPEYWNTTVSRMSERWGLLLQEQEREQIIQYLKSRDDSYR